MKSYRQKVKYRFIFSKNASRIHLEIFCKDCSKNYSRDYFKISTNNSCKNLTIIFTKKQHAMLRKFFHPSRYLFSVSLGFSIESSSEIPPEIIRRFDLEISPTIHVDIHTSLFSCIIISKRPPRIDSNNFLRDCYRKFYWEFFRNFKKISLRKFTRIASEISLIISLNISLELFQKFL